ncbi:unnamed protein product [Protopolystoma xenopodis]|uniref:Uncharacterized protein n=1 Tax=Protopolystoma xenopodis TaxID=117903 RepID=A0A448WBM3_9PLAT|nr:unnamed protein product [Protopolystoma xenopodis]
MIPTKPKRPDMHHSRRVAMIRLTTAPNPNLAGHNLGRSTHKVSSTSGAPLQQTRESITSSLLSLNLGFSYRPSTNLASLSTAHPSTQLVGQSVTQYL